MPNPMIKPRSYPLHPRLMVRYFSVASITVSGTASDNIALSKVEVKVGSGSWLPVTGTTSWSVDSVPLAVGANIITARATDSSDNVKEKSVTVTYTPSDVEIPVISITSPTDGQVLLRSLDNSERNCFR